LINKIYLKANLMIKKLKYKAKYHELVYIMSNLFYDTLLLYYRVSFLFLIYMYSVV